MNRLTLAAAALALMATSGCQVFMPEAAEEPGAAPAPSLFVAPSEAGVEPAGAGRDRSTGGGGGWGG